MTILKSYPETLTKKELYNLTMSPKTQKMTTAKGSILEVAAWCLYDDVDKEGEVRRVLSIQTPEGEIFATNSATFQDDFFRMVDLFDGVVTTIEVISGTSKGGREFIDCAYAGE